MQNEILDLPLDEPQEEELDLADGGRRFGTYLIDRILSQLLAGFLLVTSTSLEEDGSNDVSGFLLIYLTLFGYYTVMEGAFNGKTIGKFILRTKAVCEDGSPLTWEKAALRSLCRLIPFEPFSFLASTRGWHDSLSKTYVVNDRKHKI